jgi:hypothetical protein
MSGNSVFAGVLIGVSQDPPPPMGPFFGNDSNEDMILVGSESNPIPVTPNPSSTAPWMKLFTMNRDGQGWAESGPLSMVNVMEFITFPPTTSGPPVVDWHEDIIPDPSFPDSDKFKWAGGTIMTPAGVFPGVTSTDGRSIWFDFPPLPPGAPIKITKNLMWTGGTITPGPNGTNNYTVKINERPSIPEPSFAALAGLALLGAVCGLRRR